MLWSLHTLTHLSNFESSLLFAPTSLYQQLTWWLPTAGLPSSHGGCPMSSSLCCLHTTVPELGTCSTYFPEIRGRQKSNHLALKIPYAPSNTWISKSRHNSPWMTLWWVSPPGKGESESCHVPLSQLGFQVQDPAPPRRAADALATLPVSPQELAPLHTYGYSWTKSWCCFDTPFYKGKCFCWLQSFLFCWAISTISCLPLQSTFDLPAPSKSICYLNILWGNIWKTKGKRNGTFITGGETSEDNVYLCKSTLANNEPAA